MQQLLAAVQNVSSSRASAVKMASKLTSLSTNATADVVSGAKLASQEQSNGGKGAQHTQSTHRAHTKQHIHMHFLHSSHHKKTRPLPPPLPSSLLVWP